MEKGTCPEPRDRDDMPAAAAAPCDGTPPIPPLHEHDHDRDTRTDHFRTDTPPDSENSGASTPLTALRCFPHCCALPRSRGCRPRSHIILGERRVGRGIDPSMPF